MKTKTPKLDELKLTPEERDKLEAWQQQQDQLKTLQDIADMTQEIISISDDQRKDADKTKKDFGSLLMDIRESLASLKDKEAPTIPDYAKPVVDAVSKLEKTLSASIKAVDVKPVVNVDTPQVNVESPRVDLKGVEAILKSDLPRAFEKAIGLMPKVEIPKPDYKELLQAWEGISEQLVSLENATRMKPLPGSMTISNLGEVTDVLQTTIEYASRVDTTTTTDMIYIGKAPIASSEDDPVWQLKRIDVSTIAADKKWADGNDEFDNTWSGRAGKTYS